MRFSTNQIGRIPSLDGFRAISITLVLVGHLTLGFKETLADGPLKRVVSLFVLGHLGVTVFFVISGYLITSILLDEITKRGGISLTKFYYRRVLRIFPAYYFFIFVLIGLTIYGYVVVPRISIVNALLYTTDYCKSCIENWYAAHTWSLAVEEQFYLLWPVSLVLLGKRRALFGASLLLFICPLLRLYHAQAEPQAYFFSFDTVADSLAVGCLLAGSREWLHRQWWYLRLLNSKLLLLAPPYVAFISLSPNHPSFCPLWLYASAGITSVNILVMLCIDWGVTNSEGRIGKLLNAKPVATVGLMSYSIYLWQQLFTLPDAQFFRSFFPLNILGIAAAALLSYKFVEQPFLRARQRWERSLFNRREDPAPLVAAPIKSLGEIS